MNINRDYLIINDVKKSNIKLDNGSMFFYITDKNTQNIFVNLVINVSNNDLIQKYANIENAEDYTLTMNIVKPDNTYKVVEGKLHDKEKAIFEFNLNEDCCDEIGTYRCELLTKCNINDHEEITTSNKLTYKVKSSVLNDLDDIVEAPEYPLVIQLFDKLSDIEQYEEDRRANELARQLAEEQRQARFNALDADMTNSIQAIDDKVVDVENRIVEKEEAVDTLIVNTKADMDGYKKAKDQEIDEYKTAKDTEINEAITNQDSKIDTAINAQNDRIAVVENNDVAQDNRLDVLENKDTLHKSRLDAIEVKNQQQDNKLNEIEAIDIAQNTRLDAIEIKNQQQDDRLLDIEKVNKRQDMNLKCLFAESKNNMIDVTEEGNSVYLQNSTIGYTLIDEIQGNTLVNCNKEPDKEIILNGNINTSGDNAVTITEGVDGGLVDVALEGNTMVNVCDQKDSTAVTKAYTVENSGNHIALQGDVDGSCRPVITGNTLVNLITKDIAYISSGSSYNDNYITLTTTESTYGVINIKLSYNLKSNTIYTLIFPSITKTNENLIFNCAFFQGGSNVTCSNMTAVKNMITITTNDNIPSVLRIVADKGIEGSVVFGRDIIILEGDYTDKPIPDYFEGLQSSFEDNLVTQEMVDNGEELAENLGKYKVDYVVTGKNKVNIPLTTLYWSGASITLEGDTMTVVPSTDGSAGLNSSTNRQEVYYPKGTILTYSIHQASGNYSTGAIFLTPRFYHRDGSFEEQVNSMSVSTSNTSAKQTITLQEDVVSMNYIYSSYNIAGCTSDIVIKAQLEYNSEATPYEPYKEYKKTFYLNSPLLEGDTIEEKDSGIYHVHRRRKGTLTHLNAWLEMTDFPSYVGETNYKRFRLPITNALTSKGDNKIICDRFTGIDNSNWKELSNHIENDINNISIVSNKFANVNAFKQWLEQNPVTVMLAQNPTYELIEQSNLLIPSYANGHLDFDTAVPVEKVEFKPFSKELTYLYANTQYTIQFISTRAILADYYLGGALLLSQSIVKGLNRISITTPSELVDNKLTINGNDTGANIMEVIVTDVDREFIYFEGMKSVGEGKELQVISINSDKHLVNTQRLTHEPLKGTRDAKDRYVLIDGKWYIERKCGIRAYQEGDKDNYKTDLVNTVYPLEMPAYEEIDYNPLEVYSGTTNITTNSVIPPNITVKNHGFNCLLKPSTTYTVSSNLGLNTVTTPSTLTEDCLRFYDTDTSTVTTMKNVTILEGDYTTGKPLPSHFSGIESAFEQEYDEEKGKYKVKIRVQNEDASKENYIEFYISEPLRGIGDVKDKVYVKDDKVVVERNCIVKTVNGSEKGWELTKDNGNNITFRLQNDLFDDAYVDSPCICNLFIRDVTGGLIKADNSMRITEYDRKQRLYLVPTKEKCTDLQSFKQWLQQNPTTVVYPLAEPTYEEVEYNDVKLFIESFKNSTLFYNSNIPVTSKVWYSYSVPIVDTVAQTANVTDQQDQLIIDMATQVAVMEMMLM